MTNLSKLVFVTALTVMTSLFADEVLFKSGDRLSGTVKSVANGKMVFDSAVAGTITLDLKDIQTFATDEPIDIQLADGQIVSQKISVSDPGLVTVGAADSLEIAAIDKLNPEKVKWSGIITAGATFLRGNTKSDTASVGIEAARRSERDRMAVAAGYLTSKQRDNNTRKSSTIADNWFIKGQYDYFMSEKSYGYGNLRYERDRVADLEMRLTPGVGLGYQWLETDDLRFSTEAGVHWVYEKYDDANETRKYMAGRLAYHLSKDFNSKVSAFHNAEYIPSFEYVDDFLVNADLGLRAAITARLSFEAKAQLVYNSNPSEDRDKKDLRYIVGAGWIF